MPSPNHFPSYAVSVLLAWVRRAPPCSAAAEALQGEARDQEGRQGHQCPYPQPAQERRHRLAEEECQGPHRRRPGYSARDVRREEAAVGHPGGPGERSCEYPQERHESPEEDSFRAVAGEVVVGADELLGSYAYVPPVSLQKAPPAPAADGITERVADHCPESSRADHQGQREVARSRQIARGDQGSLARRSPAPLSGLCLGSPGPATPRAPH
jgi:hypothetical protein